MVKELNHSFEVEVAKDAFDAGRLVVSFRPQLIFLDLMMPGVDGFEVCTRLKQDSSTKDTEIIAITGYYTEANMDRIVGAGAAACLKKPLDVLEVRQYVIDAFNLKEVASAGDRPPANPKDETPKVLVVTQNADFRSRVREELGQTKPPVEILTAQTGADALLVAQTAPPQYVILSLAVPDVASSSLIEKLVAAGSRVQIIAVHDAPTDEMRATARKGWRSDVPANRCGHWQRSRTTRRLIRRTNVRSCKGAASVATNRVEPSIHTVSAHRGERCRSARCARGGGADGNLQCCDGL